MPAKTPEAAIEQFAEALGRGDLDAVMELYEADAVFAPQPGVVVAGSDAIRVAVGEFLALRPQMTGRIEKVLRAGDTALVQNAWSLEGTAPDGAPVRLGGTSADVVRRQADGSWLVAIDDPWGGARGA
jgi:uncharacterized protein (TIGR02246 family)